VLAPGQAREPPPAPGLLDRLPRVRPWATAATARTRSGSALGPAARAPLPTRRNEAAAACPDFVHNHRDRAGRPWGRLEERRAVAARHEKTAASLLGVLRLAATIDRLKP